MTLVNTLAAVLEAEAFTVAGLLAIKRQAVHRLCLVGRGGLG